MEKIDSRTLPLAALNERRRRAVKMRLEGASLKDTAAQCEKSRTTVIAAIKAYESGGWKAVDVDRGGRLVGSGRTLRAEQEREVQRPIRDRTPDQLKMVYALWTRQAVAELIRDRFGIELPVRTMGLYLGCWGYTPQKPMRKAYEQSPAAVLKWLDEQYPVIAACATVEGAEIHWGDETGLRSDDVRGRSFALCADIEGFSLHAAVRCGADDRQALEQMCRYITRPALANDRVQHDAMGQMVPML